jgi:uncharacterized protein (TIGR03437 family)
VVGQPFSAPLVVQTTPAAAGVIVNFAITGGSGVLSNTTQTTGSNGQASIGVTAGATAGTLTVVASVTGVSQTASFTLTISPPPPQITAASFLNGAGFFQTSGANQTALSPCGVATLVVGNPLTTAALPATPNMYAAPLQQATNISISFPSSATSGSSTAPLLNVATAVTNQQLITFQVPCDATPSSATVMVSINGSSVSVPSVTVRPAAPGIFEMTGPDGVRRAVAVRPDGSVVSPTNPARQGETVRIYITGVGPQVPALVSGALPVPTPGVVSVPEMGTVVIVAVYAPSGSPTGLGGVTVQASPDLIGVDEVTFTVPSVPSVQVGDNILALGVIAEGNPVQFQQPGGSILPIQ